MAVGLTVDVGWPWWVITLIAGGVVVVSLAGVAVARTPAVRAVGVVLLVEGAVIAGVAPLAMSDMNSSAATAAGSSSMSAYSSESIIHVIEHAPSQDMKMFGVVQTFANPIFDGRNAKRIGRDQGMCIHIGLAKGFECVWTTIVPDGSIMVQGPEVDSGPPLPLAITGGTGKFRDARGWLDERTHNKAGTQFDEFFHVTG